MRFLIVESDGYVRRRLLQSLSGKGCLVDMVFKMEDAFMLFERFTYSVIIIGAGFSDMTTAALLRAVRGDVSMRSILMRPVNGRVAADSPVMEADGYLDTTLCEEQLSAHWAAILNERTTLSSRGVGDD